MGGRHAEPGAQLLPGRGVGPALCSHCLPQTGGAVMPPQGAVEYSEAACMKARAPTGVRSIPGLLSALLLVMVRVRGHLLGGLG